MEPRGLLDGLPAARSSDSPAACPCKGSKLAELALWSRLSKTAEIINTFAEAFSMGNGLVILPHFFCSPSQASFHHSLSTTIWGRRGTESMLGGDHEESGLPWIYRAPPGEEPALLTQPCWGYTLPFCRRKTDRASEKVSSSPIATQPSPVFKLQSCLI